MFTKFISERRPSVMFLNCFRHESFYGRVISRAFQKQGRVTIPILAAKTLDMQRRSSILLQKIG